MSGEHRTPYADDALRVENGTLPEDIQRFVRRRAVDPHHIEGLTVWNFNNHKLDKETLREQAPELQQDEFVIPYQASGVWGYMTRLLPARIREAEILTYQQSTGRYVPYPNYIRHSERMRNQATRAEIATAIEGGDDGL